MSIAESRAYALFSRMLLRPLDGEALSFFEPSDASLDELAAQQHELFSFHVPPYAGFFLDEEGLVGGAAATALVDLYRDAGFHAPMPNASADHLGVIFGALSFLTARGDDDHIRELMDEHLLRWFPAFIAAARRHADGFWLSVVSLMNDLVADHRSRLGEPAAQPPLPDPPPLLENERTGLRNIARYLCTPASCGTCITRTDIHALARTLDVPRGFGSRTNMLENLLRAAAEYDRFPDAAQALANLLAAHADELADTPWADRIGNTRHILAELIANAA